MSGRDEYRTVKGAGDCSIAYWTSGSGPPLLLVHGSMGDHTRWDPLRSHLEPHFTVHRIDRRGRGASDDGADYQIEYEYQDVAAVIDDIYARWDRPISIYGHSYGGLCVFGAAPLTSNISGLILYEGWPPLDPKPFEPLAGFVERMEALLEAHDLEAVIIAALRESAGLSEREIETYRAAPSWPARVATAPTYPREERTFAETPFDFDQAARITAPTLLLSGGESPGGLWRPEEVARALPDARISVLEGQAHGADVIDPATVASAILEFLRPRSD